MAESPSANEGGNNQGLSVVRAAGGGHCQTLKRAKGAGVDHAAKTGG